MQYEMKMNNYYHPPPGRLLRPTPDLPAHLPDNRPRLERQMDEENDDFAFYRQWDAIVSAMQTCAISEVVGKSKLFDMQERRRLKEENDQIQADRQSRAEKIGRDAKMDNPPPPAGGNVDHRPRVNTHSGNIAYGAQPNHVHKNRKGERLGATLEKSAVFAIDIIARKDPRFKTQFWDDCARRCLKVNRELKKYTNRGVDPGVQACVDILRNAIANGQFTMDRKHQCHWSKEVVIEMTGNMDVEERFRQRQAGTFIPTYTHRKDENIAEYHRNFTANYMGDHRPREVRFGPGYSSDNAGDGPQVPECQRVPCKVDLHYHKIVKPPKPGAARRIAKKVPLCKEADISQLMLCQFGVDCYEFSKECTHYHLTKKETEAFENALSQSIQDGLDEQDGHADGILDYENMIKEEQAERERREAEDLNKQQLAYVNSCRDLQYYKENHLDSARPGDSSTEGSEELEEEKDDLDAPVNSEVSSISNEEGSLITQTPSELRELFQRAKEEAGGYWSEDSHDPEAWSVVRKRGRLPGPPRKGGEGGGKNGGGGAPPGGPGEAPEKPPPPPTPLNRPAPPPPGPLVKSPKFPDGNADFLDVPLPAKVWIKKRGGDIIYDKTVWQALCRIVSNLFDYIISNESEMIAYCALREDILCSDVIQDTRTHKHPRWYMRFLFGFMMSRDFKRSGSQRMDKSKAMLFMGSYDASMDVNIWRDLAELLLREHAEEQFLKVADINDPEMEFVAYRFNEMMTTTRKFSTIYFSPANFENTLHTAMWVMNIMYVRSMKMMMCLGSPQKLAQMRRNVSLTSVSMLGLNF